jgi:DNA replication protein DnaC
MLAPLSKALIRTLTNEESARLNRKHGSPQPYTECHTCQKKGFFLTRLGDGEPVECECNCREQWMLGRLLLEAGIGDTYQRYSRRHVRAVAEDVLAEVYDYIENLDAYFDAGLGLMLYSERTGTGKSLLTYLVLKEAMARGYRVYFTNFTEMIEFHTDGWTDAEHRAWFVKRLQHADFLAIDEMGKESLVKNRAEMVVELVDRVIRTRIAHGRPTIISTNLSPEGGEETGYQNLKNDLTRYHGGLISLIAERTIQVEVGGADYRQTMQKSLIADAKAGIKYPVVIR